MATSSVVVAGVRGKPPSLSKAKTVWGLPGGGLGWGECRVLRVSGEDRVSSESPSSPPVEQQQTVSADKLPWEPLP